MVPTLIEFDQLFPLPPGPALAGQGDLYDPRGWIDGVTKPRALNFRQIYYDMHTAGSNRDLGGNKLLNGFTCTQIWDGGGQVFNVRNPAFGALGNGVTEDTAAITAAISAARAVNGIVYMPPGVYPIRPDKVVVPNGVTLEGAGIDQTIITAVNSGSILVQIAPVSIGMANLRNMTISASAVPGISVVLSAANIYGGLIENVKVQGGVTGLQYADNVKFTLMRNVIIQGGSSSVSGFQQVSELSGENYFDHVSIGGGTMANGFYVGRVATGDNGAFYMRRVVCGGMTNAFVFSSTAPNTLFIALMNDCVADQTTGHAMFLNNAQDIHIMGGRYWAAGTGGPWNAINIMGSSSDITVIGCEQLSAHNGSAVGFTGSPARVRLAANTIDPGTTSIFYIPGGATPTDIDFSLNDSEGIALVQTGGEAAMAAALDTFPHWHGTTWFATNGGAGGNSAINIWDVFNKKSKFLRNTNGTLEFVNDAFSAVIATIDDDGNAGFRSVRLNGSASIFSGTVGSTPNGSVPGNPGDVLLNTSGGAGITLWVKESGVATNTGWVGK